MSDATGLAERLLGLDGFRVLFVTEGNGELVIQIETDRATVNCLECGERARAHDRVPVQVRDLPCFGRPARLIWRKRRWRCVTPGCRTKTWSESSDELPARLLLTKRAGEESCRQVGALGRSVASVAAELACAWWTVMAAVRFYGRPLVDDPARVKKVRKLGIDETAWLKATRDHSTLYATGLVDLERHQIIDLVKGNSARDLRRWTRRQSQEFLGAIRVVATDLTESYRSGLDPDLAHATRVADPFHVVRAANRTVDTVRRRVQNELLGHRGRKSDPLFRIRKLLLSGSERLDERGRQRLLLGLRVGDPHNEVLGAWLAKESVRDVYLTDDPEEAAVLLDKAIMGCLSDEVPEIRSLGNTLRRWRSEILAHHFTGASNGPTEGLNLLVKKVKRCGHGFRSFDNYRLRVLLHTGGVKWPKPHRPPAIRSRIPHSFA